MVEYQLPKLTTRVRFPSSAPQKRRDRKRDPASFVGRRRSTSNPRVCASKRYALAIRFCSRFCFFGREQRVAPFCGASIPAPKSASSLLVSGKAQNIRHRRNSRFFSPFCGASIPSPKSASSLLVSGKARNDIRLSPYDISAVGGYDIPHGIRRTV